LIPVQVWASPLELTISRPSVLKGPYGHPEDDSFAARRGKYVMSLGCGDKAAAFTEVTASAAAQRTDFIVNTAISLDRTITMALKPNHINLPTNTAQYILNGRRLHLGDLVRGCGGMSSAKVSKLSTILSSLYLFSNMTWFSPSGRCTPNLSRLSTSVKVYIGPTTSFSCCAGDYCMVRAHAQPRVVFCLHVRMHVKLQG